MMNGKLRQHKFDPAMKMGSFHCDKGFQGFNPIRSTKLNPNLNTHTCFGVRTSHLKSARRMSNVVCERVVAM